MTNQILNLNKDSISVSEVACLCSKPSGHGVSAALLMATVRAALRQRVSRKGSLKDIISGVNRQRVSDVEEPACLSVYFILSSTNRNGRSSGGLILFDMK